MERATSAWKTAAVWLAGSAIIGFVTSAVIRGFEPLGAAVFALVGAYLSAVLLFVLVERTIRKQLEYHGVTLDGEDAVEPMVDPSSE